MRRSDERAWKSRLRLKTPTRTPPNSPPLWRFFALATLAVALVGSVLFARRMQAPNLRVHADPVGTPSISRAAHASDRGATATFAASGTWVMSSLPECFVESMRVRGPYALLRDRIPPAAERLPPGAEFHVGDCSVVVGRDDVQIARGSDRLRVPPDAALYRHAGRLTLVTISGMVAEIRAY